MRILIAVIKVPMLLNRTYTTSLLIAIMLLFSFAATAQREEKKFVHYTINDGLSQGAVGNFSQDGLGYLWFGTKDGLNRFDGFEFTVFKNDPTDPSTISANNITCTASDNNGEIWIGTDLGTLDRFDHQTHSFVHYTNKLSTTKPDRLNQIMVDRKNNLWIATRGNGLLYYDREQDTMYSYTHSSHPHLIANDNIRVMTKDKAGRFWIGYDLDGLSIVDLAVDTARYLTSLYGGNDNGSKVRSFLEDPDGKMWIGTDLGAFIYYPKYDHFHMLFDYKLGDKMNTVGSMVQMDKDHVWLSRFDYGLVVVNIHSLKYRSYTSDLCNTNSLPSNGFLHLFLDKDKNLWVGTNGYGFSRLNSVGNNIKLYTKNVNDPNSITNTSIRAIIKDSNDLLYIGSYGGLSIFDTQNDTYKHFQDDANNSSTNLLNIAVYALQFDYDGQLWIGYEGIGLQRYDPISNTFHTYKANERDLDITSVINNYTFDIFLDSENRLWFGNQRGLALYDRERDRFNNFLFDLFNGNGVTVLDIDEADNGNLWLSTNKGLIYFDVYTKTHRMFEDLLPNVQQHVTVKVHSSYKDKKGSVWMATDGYGVIHFTYNKEGMNFTDLKLESIFKDTPYEQAVVYSILPDNSGRLWMSSNSGLLCYSLSSGKTIQFTNNDGLQSNEFNAGAYYKTDDGKMFFGGIKGLNAFYPDELELDNDPPPVVINKIDVLLNDKKTYRGVTDADTITLDHTSNYLSFEVAVLELGSPEKTNYKFILDGYDADWRIANSGQRSVDYANLPPGKYVFRVKGSNANGIWNEKGASVHISIIPPFWLTIWFKLLIGLCILLLIIFISYSRVRTFETQRSELERTIKLQEQKLELEKLRSQYSISKAMIEGQNSEQKRIAEDLHDGLGQTLTAANLNLSALEHELGELTPKQQEYMFSLKKLFNLTIQEVRNISHNLMPNLIVEEGLEAALDELCSRNIKASDLNIQFRMIGYEQKLEEHIEISIFRIVQEIVNNTLKHSGASELIIEIKIKKDKLTLKTEDDGIGFKLTDKNRKQNGIGLSNISVRVDLLKGNLRIKSTPGKGTSIFIEIPLEKEPSL